MFKLKQIECRHRYSFYDDLVPFEQIAKHCISEVLSDLSQIRRIKLQSEDKEILELCDKLCKKLIDIRDYFEKKTRSLNT